MRVDDEMRFVHVEDMKRDSTEPIDVLYNKYIPNQLVQEFYKQNNSLDTSLAHGNTDEKKVDDNQMILRRSKRNVRPPERFGY